MYGLALATVLAACHPRYTGFPEEFVERSPARGGVLHTVERGQTLWRIARAYGMNYQQLAEVNDLPDPRQLRVGMRVWIPGAKVLLSVEAAESTAKETVRPAVTAPRPSSKSPAPERPAEMDADEPKVAVDPGRLAWPVRGTLTSRFGVRDGSMHDGIDVAAPKGTPIVAADDAQVLWTGFQRGYGNLVILKHFDGLMTLYAHNDEQFVKAGDRVRRGQEIARVGETGRATGPHVHFEVRRERLPRNPLFFLPPL
jgi:murein DD-endopeptidase MepM/ murein hydrolase activator NlpD